MSSNDEQRELDESSLKKKKKKRTRNACDTLKTRHIYEMDRPEKVFVFFYHLGYRGVCAADWSDTIFVRTYSRLDGVF